jgi:hypothetical protein
LFVIGSAKPAALAGIPARSPGPPGPLLAGY